MKHKVKILSSNESDYLQDDINEFLASLTARQYLESIQYAAANYNPSSMRYTALIHYTEEG